VLRAVLWDFGGVILSSPFEAFARYEAENGLPPGFIRQLNATNHHSNAWAHLERGDVTLAEFAELFEAEAEAAGGSLSGKEVLDLLHGDIRPEMVEALRRVRERYTVACLTNNIASDEEGDAERIARVENVMALFHFVVESSKLGVRKPEPRFYELACETVGVEPGECVFLDDLGINLKPAREMGMTTIKVDTPEQALGELEQVLGMELRS
jgi:putative hydrolase of the HAD superfamily